MDPDDLKMNKMLIRTKTSCVIKRHSTLTGGLRPSVKIMLIQECL